LEDSERVFKHVIILLRIMSCIIGCVHALQTTRVIWRVLTFVFYPHAWLRVHLCNNIRVAKMRDGQAGQSSVHQHARRTLLDTCVGLVRVVFCTVVPSEIMRMGFSVCIFNLQYQLEVIYFGPSL